MTISDACWAAGILAGIAVLWALAYLLPDNPIDDPDGEWLPEALRVLEPIDPHDTYEDK